MLETFVPVVISLFIIEVLLSIDNALVNATLAEALPEEKRGKAIRVGIILGAVFRVFALLLASFIIQNLWLKLAGALYLIYLAIAHLGKAIDEDGKVIKAKPTMRGVITQIAIADLVFSIDNVISAVSFTDNIYLIMFGVGIGVLSMLFITPILSRLIHKYKGMPQAAYVIVGLIGVALCLETITSIHIPEVQKFIAVVGVIFFTVCYEHSLWLRRISNPILKSAQYIVAIPLDIAYATSDIFINVYKKM